MVSHLGWVGDPQDTDTEIEDNPDLKEFYQKAIEYISAQQIKRIVDNGFDYDVLAFIGGIYEAEEILRAMSEGVPARLHTRNVVVGVWDGLNGAGFFEYGSTYAHVENIFGDKMNPIHVDKGSYSLGDIFGGVEWRWR